MPIIFSNLFIKLHFQYFNTTNVISSTILFIQTHTLLLTSHNTQLWSSKPFVPPGYYGRPPFISSIVPSQPVSLMGIRDQKTKLVNKTGQLISFDVEQGICPLRDLPAGKSRSVSLSLIRKRCRERGSSDWPIRVLINGRFHGMRLHPRHHILMMTRIVFWYKWSPDGTCVLIGEGVVENFVDRVFGCFIKLIFVLINYFNFILLTSFWVN